MSGVMREQVEHISFSRYTKAVSISSDATHASGGREIYKCTMVQVYSAQAFLWGPRITHPGFPICMQFMIP
jgi:hypothetical protein